MKDERKKRKTYLVFNDSQIIKGKNNFFSWTFTFMRNETWVIGLVGMV